MFKVEDIRKDFPMFKNNPDLIYFDNSATTFKPQCVIDAINDFYCYSTSNIHRGDYDISYRVSKMYDETRDIVKKFINAHSENEIVFTSGASESLNTVCYAYGRKYIKDGVILTTMAEHASNILPWFDLAKQNNLKIEYIPLNADGSFSLDKYQECLNKFDVKLVSLPYVSNVLGYKYPIKDICLLAHRKGAIVNVDGAQAVPHLKIDVQYLDCDFLSFSAHKMLGPSGVGVLYGKYELLEKMDPLKMGGGANARFEADGSIILKPAPTKFEAGTPNIEGVLGLSKALEYLLNIGMKDIEAYDQQLVKYFMEELSKLDNVIIYNKNADCAIVSFNVKGIFAQDVASYLNANNIAVRSGNHCAKILHNVIGTNESIRASLYLYNTKEEIDRFIKIIKDVTLEKCIGAVI